MHRPTNDEPQSVAGFHLPAPTIWPAALAAGLTLLFLGVVTNLTFSLVGVGLIALAVGRWIEELRHD